MWATSHGDRTLNGDEAQLVLNSVAYLHDMITSGVDMGEPHHTEVAMFNALQPTQQMAILHEVAHGLLDPNKPVVELTAIREATIYVIYSELKCLVQIEIELSQGGKPHFDIRDQIVKASHQANRSENEKDNEWVDGMDFGESDSYEPPPRDCVETEKWNDSIEHLVDMILWDRDFQLEPAFADHDPQMVKEIKQYMGINENYFSVAAPDANSKEYLRLHRELVGLTSSLRPTDNCD